MTVSKDFLELIIKACGFISELCSYALVHFELKPVIKPDDSKDKKDGV